jgi:hypothetical protein
VSKPWSESEISSLDFCGVRVVLVVEGAWSGCENNLRVGYIEDQSHVLFQGSSVLHLLHLEGEYETSIFLNFHSFFLFCLGTYHLIICNEIKGKRKEILKQNKWLLINLNNF